MRFHIGFSKFIRPTKLLKWLGIIFIGLLALLGIDKVHADTLPLYFTNNATSGYYETVNKVTNNIVTYDNVVLDKRTKSYGNYSKTVVALNSQQSSPGLINGYLYNSMSSNGNVQFEHFQYGYYNVDNNVSCSSSDKSVDFIVSYGQQFTDRYQVATYDRNFTNLGELFALNIEAIDTNGNNYSTHCDFQSGSTTVLQNTSDYKTVVGSWLCKGVFIGNSNYTINSFRLNVVNKVDLEGDPLSSGLNYSYMSQYSFINDTDSSFSCSADPPVVDGGLPNDEGLNKVYDNIKQQWNSSIPGLDFMELDLPQSLTEIISLPIYLIQNIVDHSRDACVPYEIDFSALAQISGDTNAHYTLTLPCMRQKLPQLLGLTFYNLIDILLAAFVFYNVGLAIIQLIDAVTSGADLYTYYYSRSSKKDGTHINHSTGEVHN